MTAMEPKPDRRVAPWPDFAGNLIREGDTIRHPGGEVGRVVFRSDGDTEHARWKVDYSDGGPLSSLGLQIGDKGQAVVQQEGANADTPRDEDTLGWHALNYRTADTAQAQAMFEQLEAFVQAQIAAAVQAERERCARLCADHYVHGGMAIGDGEYKPLTHEGHVYADLIRGKIRSVTRRKTK